MTKKAVEKKVEVKVSFEDKLKNNITYLEQEIEKSKSTLSQLVGALSASNGLLDEYLKDKDE